MFSPTLVVLAGVTDGERREERRPGGLGMRYGERGSVSEQKSGSSGP